MAFKDKQLSELIKKHNIAMHSSDFRSRALCDLCKVFKRLDLAEEICCMYESNNDWELPEAIERWKDYVGHS